MEPKKPVTVVTSGYFDPLHVGHIELMEKAKALGDKLVVVVNNTSQAIQKKGHEFMPCKERMKIISSLKFVDEVVESVDIDQTQCETLALIKPDIFAKGGDRYSHEIPEAATCKEHNIEIIHGLGDKIQSSSDLVAKSKETQN
ncbi:cytidyltransferase [Candidatus Pacearchaeota archaeon]|nr:cytidyltransferase [Candidatus Pacearchaeota archaeon]|tara:strand:+ start:571 stop:999 length:429 start_codon:yes stop_codon:yes gene_type:complete